MATIPNSCIMQGKKGLIMGVANNHSIAWGIASILASHGAELAFTYQGDAFGKRVEPLAAEVGSKILLPCDVEDSLSIKNVFFELSKAWGEIDFLVHAVAFSNKDELQGKYCNTSRDNFIRTMVISCFSFTEVAKLASDMMPNGGSLVTLTYGGATKVVPNYNVMGVAKAALESSVRYLASDFGPNNIRVNAISAGPVRTLAGAGIAGARSMYNFQKEHSPLQKAVSLDDIGNSALYLLSDMSNGVTGEIHFVDSGYNIISMPNPNSLNV